MKFQNGEEKEGIMTEIFPYLKKNINPQIQKVQKILNRINTKPLVRYVIIKLLKTDKEKVLKEAKAKTHYAQEKKIKSPVDSLRNYASPRQWNSVFKVLEEEPVFFFNFQMNCLRFHSRHYKVLMLYTSS